MSGKDYTEKVTRFTAVLPALLVFWASAAPAAVSILPLADVRAGMYGTGRTVFSGDKVEDFQVEILGILQNTGPRESLILARLSGGPLEHTGVMQGMSGSPVYIEGKLIGAVAMAFPFAKDPIAGIRPIEEMFRVEAMPGRMPVPPAGRTLASLRDGVLLPAKSTGPREASSFQASMTEVATPLSLSGFTSAAVERFTPGLRSLGLEPRQGISLGGAPDMRMGDRSRLEPGSMISVELMTGDMSVGADGTLTCIDGDQIYAFGHRFLAVGPTELPFTRSEVLTLLANVNTSFKISSAKELMGVITQDRNTAVAGTLGRRAAMIPLEILLAQESTVQSQSTVQSKKVGDYRMQVVNDRFLSPYLTQMAVFSAIDATERATGASSILVRASVEFENRKDALQIRNIYTGEGGSAMVAAMNTAIPISYLMQAGFDALKIKRVSIQLETANARKELAIGQVYLSKKEAKPGDTVDLVTVLVGQNGLEKTTSARYTIPRGTSPGTLSFTVADGGQTSIADLRQILSEIPHSPDQVIANIQRLHAGDKAYVRVWRAESSFQVQGEEIPDPPPSVSLVLGAMQNVPQVKNSKMAELVIDAGDMMVTGSKTVQLEVKE
jgi:hypothetical protein